MYLSALSLPKTLTWNTNRTHTHTHTHNENTQNSPKDRTKFSRADASISTQNMTEKWTQWTKHENNIMASWFSLAAQKRNAGKSTKKSRSSLATLSDQQFLKND